MSGPRALLVESMRLEAPGVLSLTLVDPAGGHLLPWTPGAHIDLDLGEMRRQYSLCGDPERPDHYRIAVLLEPEGRGGSRFVHETLRVGQVIGLRGLRNNFALEPATHYTFVAGGIGITPLITMAEHAHAAGVPWNLVYGGRSRRTMAFLDRLAAYDDRVAVLPQDENGLLDLDPVIAAVPPGGLIYVCGPAPLIAAVRDRADAGRPDKDLVRFELFAAPAVAAAGSGREADGARDAGCVVTLARSGIDLTIAPGQSILDQVLAVGVEVDRDCEEGICGSCVTSILEGRAEHHDMVLTRQEQERQDTMMLCVSRAASPQLTLDL